MKMCERDDGLGAARAGWACCGTVWRRGSACVAAAVCAALVVLGVAALGGCASVPQGLPDDAQIEDSYFYGHWHGPDDRQLDVAPGPGKSFRLTIRDAMGTRKYDGHLVRVDEVPFAELNLFSPGSGSSDAGKVPVFLYAQVKIEPTKFTFRPVRTAWLKEAVSNMEGAAFISTPGRPRTEGGVVVRDAGVMRDLLRRALAEPGAIEAGEEYRRQN